MKPPFNCSRSILFTDEFPWQISLRSVGTHICGGSIINQNQVITAAHCVEGASPVLDTVSRSWKYAAGKKVFLFEYLSRFRKLAALFCRLVMNRIFYPGISGNFRPGKNSRFRNFLWNSGKFPSILIFFPKNVSKAIIHQEMQ